MGSYKEWISAIDINIDYYAAFIKAWIAFNSWYREIYGTNYSDSVIIEKIKTEHNTFRTALTNLLNSKDQVGIMFRGNIGQLHIALEASTILSQERSKERVPISFNSIAVVNPNNKVSGVRVWYDEIFIERTKINVTTRVKKTTSGNIICEIIQDRYDLDELTINAQFKNLKADCQRKCVECYRSVSPYLTETILTNIDPCFECNGIKFVNDTLKVNRGIVDVLYLLRCSLMHGDVAPNQSNMQVYKYAYNILFEILKKLL